MVDLISLSMGLVVGAGSASLLAYYLWFRPNRKVIPQKGESLRSSRLPPVDMQEFERSKRETKILLLEKDLLSAALTRVYEAEADGIISKDEREQLASKYRAQMKALDERLLNVEIVVEVGELERLRHELLSLFEQKIGQIEGRLKETRARMAQLKVVPRLLQTQPITSPPIPNAEEEKKVAEKKKAREESPVDKKVKELREEVLQALARLEQIDLEG